MGAVQHIGMVTLYYLIVTLAVIPSAGLAVLLYLVICRRCQFFTAVKLFSHIKLL